MDRRAITVFSSIYCRFMLYILYISVDLVTCVLSFIPETSIVKVVNMLQPISSDSKHCFLSPPPVLNVSQVLKVVRIYTVSVPIYLTSFLMFGMFRLSATGALH